LGPGSADIESLRDLTTSKPWSRKGDNQEIASSENVWQKGRTPQEEKERLKDFVVLSPVSAKRSPFSASRADRGLVFQLERPYRFLWRFIWAIYYTIWFLLFDDPKEHNEQPEPDVRVQTAHRQEDILGASMTGAAMSIYDDEDHEVDQPHEPASRPSHMKFTAPENETTNNLANALNINDPSLPVPVQQSSPSLPINISDTITPMISLQNRITSPHHSPEILPEQRFPQGGTPHIHKQRPKRYNYPSHSQEFTPTPAPAPTHSSADIPTQKMPRLTVATVQRLEAQVTSSEQAKLYAHELAALDRTHKPDLASSFLSALFTTLPVLALYFIHSVPFRLFAVIIFTLLFAIGLSLAYKPSRGEVFATTAA